ncbi:MAG: hypothetical protein M9928_02795 [Anaerolineae bacterium]|nr:hypothetical protein [Anaerolineae bacterium]
MSASAGWTSGLICSRQTHHPLWGDDLFCNQPFCEQVIANNQYSLACKPDSHVELYRWLAALTPHGTDSATLEWPTWDDLALALGQ